MIHLTGVVVAIRGLRDTLNGGHRGRDTVNGTRRDHDCTQSVAITTKDASSNPARSWRDILVTTVVCQ